MKRTKDEEDLRGGVAFLLLSVIILLFGAFIFFNRPRAPERAKKPSPDRIKGSVGDQLLGVYLRTEDGHIVIDEALKNGNAIKAGLKNGDVLLALDGLALKAIPGDIVGTYKPLLERLKRARLGQSLTVLIKREGEPEPRTIVVALKVEPGRGPELRLANRLIKQTIRQLLDQRRSDGWWPHYADEERPSVAVTALVAHALRRAEESLDGAEKTTLKDTLDKLVGAQAKDGGLVDPAQVVQHRVYASALALQALSAGDPQQPLGDGTYTKPVERLQAWLIKAQVQEEVPGNARGYDPIDPRYGGWSYHDDFRSRRLRTDVSTARFALQALADDELSDDALTWQRAGLFLDLVQNHTLVTTPKEPGHRREVDLRDGGFSFTPRMSKAGEQVVSPELHVGRSYGSATADGLLALLALRGIDRRTLRGATPLNDPRVLASLRWLASHYTVERTPGFGPGSPWPEGLHFYYLAALSEALHRAGLWKLILPDGSERVWAADVVKLLGSLRQGGFRNPSGYMHEDCESIAASFALLALTAARERLQSEGAGGTLKAGAAPKAASRDAELPLPPPTEVLARGQALFEGQAGCKACHNETPASIGPSLESAGDVYLGKEDRNKDQAKARMKRFVRDPLTTIPLLNHGGAKMIAINEKQVSDADLDAILEWLLHR